MRRYAVLLGLAVLAGALLTRCFLTVGKNGTGAAVSMDAARAGAAGPLPKKAAARLGAQARLVTGRPMSPQVAARLPASATGSAAGSPREHSASAWEALIARVIEQPDVPAADQSRRVKAAFDRLAPSDRMDAIHRALNLLPDAQFPALYGILMDKAESPEVLDAIFNDALNRPEELKNPLMKELRRDREHPLFFESARILDAIGK
jgi:hypothetical protein